MRTQHGLEWTLSVIVAVSLLSAPTVRTAGATLDLVQDGKAVYTVVVPDGKDAAAMSAATMLADIVGKASGARLAIVQEAQAPAGPKVFIDKTRAAEKAGLNVAAMKGLASVLKVVDGNLFLTGNDRGGGSRMLSGPFKWDVDMIMDKKVLPDTGHRVPPFNQD